jgi:hypothetical protein
LNYSINGKLPKPGFPVIGSPVFGKKIPGNAIL